MATAWSRGEAVRHRRDATTALMAATGIGGGRAWVQVPRGERERLTLEAVRLAVELGIDINAANTDERTALDGAADLKYESVVTYLREHGAKGTGKPGPPIRVPN